jgi:hypothetical protein
MKFLFPLLFFIAAKSFATDIDLRDSEWITIKIERKDGSKILDRTFLATKPLKWNFQNTTVLTSYQIEPLPQPYKIERDRLIIGIQQYSIDTLTDEKLVVSEIPKYNLPDDRVNRFFFVRSNTYFKYLTDNGMLKIQDETVFCTDICAITSNAKVTSIIIENCHITSAGLTGTLTLSSDGQVKDVTMDPNTQLTARSIKEFKDALYLTNGSWNIPRMEKPADVKIGFTCSFTLVRNSQVPGLRVVSFGFYAEKPLEILPDGTSSAVQRYFNRGENFFKKKKWAEATEEFLNCIAIDSFCLDAYYKLGECYQLQGKTQDACTVWKALADLDQTKGKQFLKENCN